MKHKTYNAPSAKAFTLGARKVICSSWMQTTDGNTTVFNYNYGYNEME